MDFHGFSRILSSFHFFASCVSWTLQTFTIQRLHILILYHSTKETSVICRIETHFALKLKMELSASVDPLNHRWSYWIYGSPIDRFFHCHHRSLLLTYNQWNTVEILMKNSIFVPFIRNNLNEHCHQTIECQTNRATIDRKLLHQLSLSYCWQRLNFIVIYC